MKTAANSLRKCILAIVIVDGNKHNVLYFTNWIDTKPSFPESKRSFDLKKLRQVSQVTFEKEVLLLGGENDN